ncbi:PaaI family thioesterase [Salisediminibacterium halotolerans]|uniref:PaaI family thioesterase n=1 Tax=Salisediminibacterium halotolerans TaxID=517425 RepID=UPI000EB2D522|nr:PaaI family thioesterase [Salisediminibacterium halotolerans]GEL08709.1 hypothetical protein SHA02_21250 [Salisediminibacterium halotolerans]
MDKEMWREKLEKAMEDHEEGTPQLFLYSMLDFAFDYDEEKEAVVLTAPVSEIMFNPVGFIHGGVITYMADTALGHLCAAFLDQPSVSLELKTQFFRTVNHGSLKAIATFQKKGKNVQFAVCRIFDESDHCLAETTGTFYAVKT